MAVIAWVIGGIVALFVLFIIATFNSLISLRNRVDNAWSQIDVQLKRRYDLIPNLINTVKGYMKHEKGVLTEVTKMRSNLISGSMSQKSKASDSISNKIQQFPSNFIANMLKFKERGFFKTQEAEKKNVKVEF